MKRKRKIKKKIPYNPTFKGVSHSDDNFVIKKMEKNIQRGRKKIQETQKHEYKDFYQKITPVLRLFYFLKTNDQLMNEVVLNDFKMIFEECEERNKKLQKKFNENQEENPDIRNRVKNHSFYKIKTEEMSININKFVESTLKEIKRCENVLKSRNFTTRI